MQIIAVKYNLRKYISDLVDLQTISQYGMVIFAELASLIDILLSKTEQLPRSRVISKVGQQVLYSRDPVSRLLSASPCGPSEWQ